MRRNRVQTAFWRYSSPSKSSFDKTTIFVAYFHALINLCNSFVDPTLQISQWRKIHAMSKAKKTTQNCLHPCYCAIQMWTQKRNPHNAKTQADSQGRLQLWNVESVFVFTPQCLPPWVTAMSVYVLWADTPAEKCNSYNWVCGDQHTQHSHSLCIATDYSFSTANILH